MAEPDEITTTASRSPQKRIRAVFIGWGAINIRVGALLTQRNAAVEIVGIATPVGLDKTRVEMVADPAVRINGHRIAARGAFGRLEILLENNPLATNPKTSELTALSLVRLIEHQTHAIAI